MNNPQVTPAAPGTEENLPLLPRVNIHVFFDTQETVAVMQSVAADRRMSRAHMEIRPGGIPAAVQTYTQAVTPQLLVVESVKPREELLAELASLAQVCSPETKVIVIGHLNDIGFYRQLISEGVSDYLAAPVSPRQILSSFASLFVEAADGKLGKIITFLGAKGGVGSSIIAHNIGWLISKRFETDTVIADLDLAFGTAGLDFNVDPAQGIIDALAASDRIDAVFLDRLLTKCSERLLLLASPGSVERVVDIQAEALELVLDTLRASTPVTIVDMPSTWGDWMRAALVQSEILVITATPELASLRNAKSIVDRLKSLRPNDEPPLLVLNQVGVGKRPEIPADEFSRAVGLDIAVTIPFDAQTFGKAVTNGQMIFDVGPRTKAAEALTELASRIIGVEEKKQTGKSFLQPLLEKLGKKGKK